jgi:hypothetical protein
MMAFEQAITANKHVSFKLCEPEPMSPLDGVCDAMEVCEAYHEGHLVLEVACHHHLRW